jgi:2-methylcitrate dehydratase PrpD
VIEGKRGLFSCFARDSNSNYEPLTKTFAQEWWLTKLTFKPYATGTMNQPYIDCALRLAKRGFAAEEVAEVLCETAEGYVQRLWEPLAAKQAPPNAYAAKFSVPFNVAVAFVTGGAGLTAFSEATVKDPRVLALAARIRYAIDPTNPYPRGYTGHVRMMLRDGRVFEERQPHIRGGAAEPLSREEIEAKFHGNARHGGWSPALAEQFVECSRKIFDEKVDLSPFRR